MPNSANLQGSQGTYLYSKLLPVFIDIYVDIRM